jgi:hypothetical protein
MVNLILQRAAMRPGEVVEIILPHADLNEEEDYVGDEEFLHDDGTPDLEKCSQTLTTIPSSTFIPEMQLVGLCSWKVKKLTEKSRGDKQNTDIAHAANDYVSMTMTKLILKYSTSMTVLLDEQHFLHLILISTLFILK